MHFPHSGTLALLRDALRSARGLDSVRDSDRPLTPRATHIPPAEVLRRCIRLLVVLGCCLPTNRLTAGGSHVERRMARNCWSSNGNDVCTYGFIDRTGEWMIDPQFDEVLPFTEDLSAVRKGLSWGYINRVGEIVIPFQFTSRPSVFCDGSARIYRDGGCVYIDRTGKDIFKTVFEAGGPFTKNRAFVRRKGEQNWSLIDERGTVVKTDTFESCALTFSGNGLAAVMVGGLWGYIDTLGDFVIRPQFNSARNFSEGLACVRAQDGTRQCGYIDSAGCWNIGPRFDEGEDFSEGLAAVRINDRWGYVEPSGCLKISFRFRVTPAVSTSVYPFSDGLACVLCEGKYGFIDRNGEMTIPPQYSSASPFRDGLAAVVRHETNGEYFASVLEYIDKTGRVVWRERRRQETSHATARATESP